MKVWWRIVYKLLLLSIIGAIAFEYHSRTNLLPNFRIQMPLTTHFLLFIHICQDQRECVGPCSPTLMLMDNWTSPWFWIQGNKLKIHFSFFFLKNTKVSCIFSIYDYIIESCMSQQLKVKRRPIIDYPLIVDRTNS